MKVVCRKKLVNRSLAVLIALASAVLASILIFTAFTQRFWAENHDSITNLPNRIARRKVALMGPHDRYNFGDLLFEMIVSHLLIDKAGYLPTELVAVGITQANMSRYGGNPNIVGAKTAVEMSHREAYTGTGPFDIVFLGGEALLCRFSRGVSMFPAQQQKLAEAQKISDCAYLMPKERLVPPNLTITAKPVAIVNSPGISGSTHRDIPCNRALDSADFIAFRDLTTNHSLYPHAQLRPDSAVMVDQLYRNEIANRAQSGELGKLIAKATPYIAVQMKLSDQWDVTALAQMLDGIWHHTNFTTVFFMAGSAPGHDTTKLYTKISSKMKSPSIVFAEEHVWSVVGLISKAAAVLSTSLHVRIMAFVYKLPRLTFCSRPKHRRFIQLWEPSDASLCLPFGNQNLSDVWPALEHSINTSPLQTELAVERAVQSYLEGFDQWSSLLNK